jgi:hypothetical protein
VNANVAGLSSAMVVTDSGTNQAEMFAYPSGRLLRTLADFSEPQGACSDGAGHFWITNTGDSNVLEYSTTGTLLRTLGDPNNYPVGCAYDPKTGNLAITNIITTSDGPGSVAMYAKATGTPKLYATSLLERVYFASFAGSTGTLAILGENASYQPALAALTSGKFTLIVLKGVSLEYPSVLAWSAKTHSMNLGDQDSPTVYRFELNGKVTGTTKIDCAGCDIIAYAIFGGTPLTTGSLSTVNGRGLESFKHPAGGPPKKSIPEKAIFEPIGRQLGGHGVIHE